MTQQEIYKKFGKTHWIERKQGVDVDLARLNEHQSVCSGDMRTYYWLLTEKNPDKLLDRLLRYRDSSFK